MYAITNSQKVYFGSIALSHTVCPKPAMMYHIVWSFLRRFAFFTVCPESVTVMYHVRAVASIIILRFCFLTVTWPDGDVSRCANSHPSLSVLPRLAMMYRARTRDYWYLMSLSRALLRRFSPMAFFEACPNLADVRRVRAVAPILVHPFSRFFSLT